MKGSFLSWIEILVFSVLIFQDIFNWGYALAVSTDAPVPDPLCGLIASTNIETFYSIWSCNTSGYPIYDQCSWTGVLCDSTNYSVVSVSITQTNLTGTLPDSLGDMSSLTSLSLVWSDLDGTLPAYWSSFSLLAELSLNDNNFTGSLPSEWSEMPELQKLYLYGNNLTGSLPSDWGSMSRIQHLSMANNNLTGSLPSAWGSLGQVEVLVLYGNMLTGSLPETWACLNSVRNLYIFENELSGSLPSAWGSLKQLEQLYLYINKLSCSIPLSFGSLSQLQQLSISRNRLTGVLPTSLASLVELEFVFLYDNSLEGSIPVQFGSLTAMEFLYLSLNSLSGSLPSSLGSMTELLYLSLSENDLSGPLPPSLFTLPSLRFIDLSQNGLSGSLPGEVNASNSLTTIYLSFNSFSNSIPSSMAGAVNLTSLNVSFTGVTGAIPSVLCSSAGVSIDVTATAIQCYTGCLTSSRVLVYGASAQCHNGEIMREFFIFVGVFLGLALGFTALGRYFYQWQLNICLAADFECGYTACSRRWLANSQQPVADGTSQPGNFQVLPQLSPALKRSVVVIAFGKLVLGSCLSMMLTWWKYGGGKGAPGNDEAISSCTQPSVDSCYSFCGDVSTISFPITDDDFQFNDDYYEYPVALVHPHEQLSSYCIANLPRYCAYDYWLYFRMVPLLLHVVGFILQLGTWWICGDFVPQQKQYDEIIANLYPQVYDANKSRACDIGVAGRLRLLRKLASPISYSVFAFLEILTVTYVWGELLFPPLYCGLVRPLSMYYYPVLMSLLDLLKFNIYVASRLLRSKRFVEGLFALLDIELFATNLWLTCALGLLFIRYVLCECTVGVWRLIQSVFGLPQELRLAWAVSSPASETTANPLRSSVAASSSGSVPEDTLSGVRLPGWRTSARADGDMDGSPLGEHQAL